MGDSDTETECASQPRLKKRKQYLEPGQAFAIPRATLRFQASGSSGGASQASAHHVTSDAVPADCSSARIVPVTSDTSDSEESDDNDRSTRGADNAVCADDGASTHSGGLTEDEDASDEDTASDVDKASDVEDFLKLFSNDRLPNSQLSVADAMVMLMAYSTSAGLNWKDMEKLVHVMNLLLGAEVLPSSQYLLRKAWKSWQGQLIKRHYFCTSCSTRAVNPSGRDFVCANCDTPNSAHNFFAILSLKKQIEVLLSKEDLAMTLLGSLRKAGRGISSQGCPEDAAVLTDITDGALYHKQMVGHQWSDISLTFSTDGAKVFNCNKTALWPIQCIINELPVALRWSNVLLGGLWFGKGHPEMTQFLDVFVKELLAEGAVKWQCHEQKIQSRIEVVCCCVDAPARAAVLNSKQFNGYFGCSVCLHEGERHGGE